MLGRGTADDALEGLVKMLGRIEAQFLRDRGDRPISCRQKDLGVVDAAIQQVGVERESHGTLEGF